MKILILTTIYPRNDAEKTTMATKVIHYFAHQWQKSGNEIFVVHCASTTFKLIHMLPESIKTVIKTRTGNEIANVNITKKSEYSFEGINVYRRPFRKAIPHSLPSDKTINSMCRDIHSVLEKNGFEPDLIIGHWTCPTVQLLSGLNTYYSCKKSVVLHDKYYIPYLKDKLNKYIKDIDAIGCRSASLSERVKDILSLEKIPFVCASGVPDEYLEKLPLDISKFDKPITNFIYVGELIDRKYCDTVIRCLAENVKKWHLDIIGIGNKKDELIKLARELKAEDNITFHGRIPRDNVIKLMQQAQCFVMPSKDEAFGLVYLEAMAASCITIGSKNEGIDGIIINGENGYLAKAGNVDSLSDIIKSIAASDAESLKKIARAGYNTANKYSDSAVAQRYLEDVLNW